MQTPMEIDNVNKKSFSLYTLLEQPVHIAPLAILRVGFGSVMLLSILRFISNGWIKEFYITPKFFFSYYGFEWVKPLGGLGMYVLFAILAISALLVALGFFYRISIVLFFLLFTYVELIDKTYYLNHYYFISIISFLLIFVPAHHYFSVDSLINRQLKSLWIPAWCINIFKLQLCLVYLFAGMAKLNSDWLLHAMPLKLWLPPHSTIPVIGTYLDETWVAYFFSWFGAAYDLCIWIFLLKKNTRFVAYILVISFHVLTAILFPIGMFPYIMITMTLIFFSEKFHMTIIGFFTREAIPVNSIKLDNINSTMLQSKPVFYLLAFYFFLQLLLPFRYLAYDGDLFWTEEGFRFSWRVMLMEKAGSAFFYVKDHKNGKESEVINTRYLTPLQEKMMATQPDMILQFAHFLKDEYSKKGYLNPEVRVESYVALNGRGSRLFIDPATDLTKKRENFFHKDWILSSK